MLCLLAAALAAAGCLGPPALHHAVLGYDETISRLEHEMLLLNIARTDQNLPPHFTVTSAIAATFDYRTTVGIGGSWLVASLATAPGVNSYNVSLGASAAENPTLSIVPVQGEEFTRRVLGPMAESKFEFLVFQGAPIDMVLRLMADGIELQTPDGRFERFVLNWSSRPAEYEEFRRRVLHLAWLNATRRLFVGALAFEETLPVTLTAPPTAAEVMGALDKGLRWTRADGGWELRRSVTGRVAITNYDPRTLSDEARQALNARASANPANFVLVDIRPGHPGGDFPLFGAFKLRSLNVMLAFAAASIHRLPELDVAPDPRTGPPARNPRRTLAIEVTETASPGSSPRVAYGGRHYAVADTPWDREAFTLLSQLFQMTVTDVSKTGVPITISK